MKKLNLMKVVLMTALSFLLFNCESNSEEVIEVDSVTSEKARMCLFEMKNSNDDNARGVSTPSLHWKNGQTITVSFLNGSANYQARVKEYASEWEKYANIKFKWVSSNSSADIRIKFDARGGHWSRLGTQSKGSGQSMNIGYEDNGSSDYGFRGTTIHEFGHALGLSHEHQNPVAGIKWNKPAVYKYFAGAPNYWDKAKVDHNLFRRLDKNTTNYSEYDPKSIMHYSVRNEHTLDNFSVGNNNKLSAIDKEYIAEVYPKADTTPPTGDICDGVAPYKGRSFPYSVGDKVTSQGTLYQRTSSGWINLGACGASAPADICDGVSPYNSNSSYSVGDKVTSQGTLYQRTFNGWNNLGACGN
ncbi:M12 family metallopeptidase [Tenacibaculum ovolyticum]|uniref:M12 family metallopeptidase n=1 Tax=Tenacibaculum ovolyticum TaxID=104270 RepID=UPI003BA8747E